MSIQFWLIYRVNASVLLWFKNDYVTEQFRGIDFSFSSFEASVIFGVS